ncbi:MAG: hypothetical protein Q8P56_00265 [Candidatus Uhrbacteria bacterium]|nr:hypothetical protein [Candidatus Uhrbacteria bacterium]
MAEFTIEFKMPQDPERRKPEDVNQEMMDKANGFYQAGSRCAANITLSPNITNSLLSPAVVCYAFAIEIYLKLLLRQTLGKDIKGHNLKVLFSILPEETKEIARKKFASNNLEAEIERVASAFVDNRYDYENTNFFGLSTSMLAQIGSALHNTIKELNPKIGITFENRLAI